MRLLWEESGFELVGAFCVAAFSLLAAWLVLERLFGLNGAVAGLLAVAAAGWVLESISRRHYADRRPIRPRRPAQAGGGVIPAEARGGATAADARGWRATPAEARPPARAHRPAAGRGAMTYAAQRQEASRDKRNSRLAVSDTRSSRLAVSDTRSSRRASGDARSSRRAA